MQKRAMNTGFTILLVSIILIVTIAGVFSLTGFAVLNKDQKEPDAASRHVFYFSPRVPSDYQYQSSCYPQSEVMPIIPNATCCKGLKELTIYDEQQADCSAPLLGGAICSDCGNKKCEFGETNCNCPIDCTKKPKKQ